MGARILILASIHEGETIRKDWGETQWAALVAARETVLRCPKTDVCILLVAGAGIEPATTAL